MLKKKKKKKEEKEEKSTRRRQRETESEQVGSGRSSVKFDFYSERDRKWLAGIKQRLYLYSPCWVLSRSPWLLCLH